MLLDWVGCQTIDEVLVERMEAAGVKITLSPAQWYHLVRMNNRTHRKLLVVDGRGFTGGVGIADQWHGTPGSRPLARHALPHRGSGGRAAAGRVPRQLDEDTGHV